ncbi:MAG: carboxymuconolactone decarboxylase family protein [Phenylobacterium sp.]
MSLLDPAERGARGRAAQAELVAAQPPEPATLWDSSLPDYVYAEVWTRPGLDLRARFLISLAGAACKGDELACRAYARGALHGGHLSLAELREAALHIAVYGHWSAGGVLDRGVSGAAQALGLADEPYPPLRPAPWDPQERIERGAHEFDAAMTFGGPPPVTPYFEAGILNFVFGEMWHRPGLDQRSRRWVTLVGVCESRAEVPIKSHIHAAMASGNCQPAELQEFVLQLAIHAGWPLASLVQAAVIGMIKNHEAGLSWEGKAR